MLINCTNKKCKGDRRKNQVVFDCHELNEMIGREVIRKDRDVALCKDCILLYYRKTYEEILEIDKGKGNTQ